MAVSHKVLPNSELHNPKGFDTFSGPGVLRKLDLSDLEPSYGLVTDDYIANNTISGDKLTDTTVAASKLIADDALRTAIESVIYPTVTAGSLVVFYRRGVVASNGGTSYSSGNSLYCSGSAFSALIRARGFINVGCKIASDGASTVIGQILKNGAVIADEGTSGGANIYIAGVAVVPGDVITWRSRDFNSGGGRAEIEDAYITASDFFEVYPLG